MPQAGKCGALLGVAYELHTNSLLNRSFCGVRCVITMVAGAMVARAVSRWDREARLCKQVDQAKDMPLYSEASWH